MSLFTTQQLDRMRRSTDPQDAPDGDERGPIWAAECRRIADALQAVKGYRWTHELPPLADQVWRLLRVLYSDCGFNVELSNVCHWLTEAAAGIVGAALDARKPGRREDVLHYVGEAAITLRQAAGTLDAWEAERHGADCD